MTATAVAATDLRVDTSPRTAYRLPWLAVILDFLAFRVGSDWDRRWHTTHALVAFFSPPHLFIDSMHLCATITLAYIAFTPDLRCSCGATYRVPLVRFPVPGAIGLAGAGFGLAMPALTGIVDPALRARIG